MFTFYCNYLAYCRTHKDNEKKNGRKLNHDRLVFDKILIHNYKDKEQTERFPLHFGYLIAVIAHFIIFIQNKQLCTVPE